MAPRHTQQRDQCRLVFIIRRRLYVLEVFERSARRHLSVVASREEDQEPAIVAFQLHIYAAEARPPTTRTRAATHTDASIISPCGPASTPRRVATLVVDPGAPRRSSGGRRLRFRRRSVPQALSRGIPKMVCLFAGGTGRVYRRRSARCGLRDHGPRSASFCRLPSGRLGLKAKAGAPGMLHHQARRECLVPHSCAAYRCTWAAAESPLDSWGRRDPRAYQLAWRSC